MASEWLFTWFQNNSIKANKDKFHLLLTDSDFLGTEAKLKTLSVKIC